MTYIREYDSAWFPSMPIVDLVISNPVRDVSENLTAIIDTGADGTFLPITLLEQMGFPRIGWINARGISGFSYRVPQYAVDVVVGGVAFESVRVVGDTNGESIIGRNILNKLVMTLDGFAQTLTIQPQ